MSAGNIILLNGASSSGKTTILKALQEVLNTPYLDAGLDKFLWMLPKRYLDQPFWNEVFSYTWHKDGPGRDLTIRAGPLGHQLVSGMHQAIAALATTGNHVIADHVLIESSWLRECTQLFAELPVLFVGVYCPLKVLEQREQERGDRTLGQARAYLKKVHAHGVYDLKVNTAQSDPQECALQIKQRMENGPPPQAFKLLLERMNY